MVREAKINQRAHVNGSRTGLRGSMSHVASDMLTIAELQWQLLMEDIRQAIADSLKSTLVIVAGSLLAICALPVAMHSIAHLLAAYFGISLGWSLLAVAGVSGALGTVAVLIGVRNVRRSFSVFERSRTELQQNLASLKNTLSQRDASSVDAHS